MSFIKNRLRRLEEARRGGPCPECKLRPDGPGYIVLEDRDHEPPAGAVERCGRCGRRLYFVIRVVYEGDEETTEGEG